MTFSSFFRVCVVPSKAIDFKEDNQMSQGLQGPRSRYRIQTAQDPFGPTKKSTEIFKSIYLMHIEKQIPVALELQIVTFIRLALIIGFWTSTWNKHENQK